MYNIIMDGHWGNTSLAGPSLIADEAGTIKASVDDGTPTLLARLISVLQRGLQAASHLSKITSPKSRPIRCAGLESENIAPSGEAHFADGSAHPQRR